MADYYSNTQYSLILFSSHILEILFMHFNKWDWPIPFFSLKWRLSCFYKIIFFSILLLVKGNHLFFDSLKELDHETFQPMTSGCTFFHNSLKSHHTQWSILFILELERHGGPLCKSFCTHPPFQSSQHLSLAPLPPWRAEGAGGSAACPVATRPVKRRQDSVLPFLTPGRQLWGWKTVARCGWPCSQDRSCLFF